MKKIFLMIPLVALSLNAEMIAQGESSSFIVEKNQDELSTVTAKERKEIREVEKKRVASLPPKKIDNSHLSVEENSLLPEVYKSGDTTQKKVYKEESIKREVYRGGNTKNSEDEFNTEGLNLLPQKIVNKNVDLKVNDLHLNPENSKNKTEPLIKGMEQLKKIELKQYNISYDTEYTDFSLEPVSPEAFTAYLDKNKINKLIFKRILNSNHSLKTIKISAYYYDYYLARPDYAENFYRILYKKRNKLKMGDQFVLADYLIRTGRGDKIHTFIKREVCSTKFGNSVRGKCFYYLGVDYYLRTGDRKNGFMKIAKNKLKKAKKFYYAK